MKKIVVIFVCLILLFSVAVAAEPETEMVAQMTYIVKMPDVIREGKYTGEVKDGVPNGYGFFEATNSAGVNWHYIGEWVNGNMTGKGGQYWDIGRCTIGTYENGNMLSGHIYDSPSAHIWVDYTPNDHGCLDCIEYRSDGSVLFEGCVKSDNNYHQGTIYTEDGKVFFSGEIGEGFNWNLVYVD